MPNPTCVRTRPLMATVIPKSKHPSILRLSPVCADDHLRVAARAYHSDFSGALAPTVSKGALASAYVRCQCIRFQKRPTHRLRL